MGSSAESLTAATQATLAEPRATRSASSKARASRTFLACLLVATALHVPATPLGSYLSHLLPTSDSDTEEDDADALVPISLEIDLNKEEPEQEAKPKPEAEKPKPPEPPKTPPPPPPEPEKETTPPPVVEQPQVPETLDVAPQPPKPVPETAPAVKEPPKTPIADLKVALQLTAKNSNHVQVVLVGANLRKHSVGARLGALFSTLPDWEGFFAGSSIDPVNDVDAIILTGPRLRVTGEVLAILQFSKPIDTMHDVVDKLVQGAEPKGTWIDGAPVDAARTTVQKVERIFALVPEQRLVYAIPSPYPSKAKREALEKDGKLEESLEKAKKRTDDQLKRVKRGSFKDYTKEEFAIDAYMTDPYKLVGKDGKIEVPLLGEIEILPKSIRGGRITVVPKGDDAIVSLSGEAEDEAEAAAQAQRFNSLWPMASMAARSKYGLDLPELTFTSEGKIIKASATVSAATLERMYTLAVEHADELKAKAKEKTGS